MSESPQLNVRCSPELLAALDECVEDDRTPFANRSDAARVALRKFVGLESLSTDDRFIDSPEDRRR